MESSGVLPAAIAPGVVGVYERTKRGRPWHPRVVLELC
jgi:hypothetical protein